MLVEGRERLGQPDHQAVPLLRLLVGDERGAYLGCGQIQRIGGDRDGLGQFVAHLLEADRPFGSRQREQVAADLMIEPGRLRGRGHGVRDRLRGLLPSAGRLEPAPVQFRGDPVIQLGAEQPGEHGAPVIVTAPQELRELALWQQHDLGELCPVEPDGLGDQLTCLGLVRRQAGPPAVLHPLQVDPHGLGRVPVAPFLQPLVLRHPRDPVADASEGEFHRHRWLDVRGREVRMQPVGPGVLPGQPSVQRERNRVQDGGLSRPGRALQQEQAAGGEPVEVDPLRGGVRAERLQFHTVQAHQATPCRRIRRSPRRTEQPRRPPAGPGAVPGRAVPRW